MNVTTETAASARPSKWPNHKSRSRIDIQTHNFGFQDNRRRDIGIFATIDAITIEEADPTARWLGIPAPLYEATEVGGQIYRVYAHVTRNGTTYGAHPGDIEFATLEEARKWLADRIKRCERDNRRKFAKA